jgi:hypothetical protein
MTTHKINRSFRPVTPGRVTPSVGVPVELESFFEVTE